MKKRPCSTLHACALCLLTAGGATACDEGLQAFPLNGRLYNVASDCLAEELVIDVIEGTDSGVCDGVRCIRSVETGDHFITTACEVPDLYEDLTEAEEGPCADARAAHDRGEAGLCT